MIPETASLWAAARRFEGVLRRDASAYSFAPLSDIYRRLGLLEEALDAARKGCSIHPDFAAGQMALARAALEFAFKDEALKALESVVRVTPENLEAQRLLADLYTADGKEAAALHCLAVANSLDTEPPQQFAAAIVEEEIPEEEMLEADILELSDELIEDEEFADNAVDPFAALPDRPSLGEDFSRAEPFLLETPPPIYHDEPPATEASPLMLSATIAELYISQGFTDRGVDVYRELLNADPLNEIYINRLTELTQPVDEPSIELKSTAAEGILAKLYEWLGNIGRIRECRTKNL